MSLYMNDDPWSDTGNGAVHQAKPDRQYIQEIAVQVAQIHDMLTRIQPLVEYAEKMMNSTPTQRLKQALGR